MTVTIITKKYTQLQPSYYESPEGSNKENRKILKSRNYEIESRNYEIKTRNYEIKSRNKKI